MSTTELVPTQVGRSANGRFAKGNPGGPGNKSDRIHVPTLARRKAEEMGIDLDHLLWDVVLAMLIKGACGDVAAAKLAYEMIGEQPPKSPLVNIDASGRRPTELPPLEADPRGGMSLRQHLETLARVARERGITRIIDGEIKPAEIVTSVANHQAEVEDLLS